MLDKKQRDTLFFFLDTISKLLHESQVVSELDALELDMNRALVLMELGFSYDEAGTSLVNMHALYIYIIECVISFL